MRRILAIVFLLALAAPLGAAGSNRTSGDGVLSVRDLNGFISIQGRGAVIGRCDQCTFRLEDRMDEAVVTGAERSRDIDNDGQVEWYQGRDIRWKLIGGWFWLRVRQGKDIDISAVGRATVRVYGTAGTYVVNGGDPIPVLGESVTFPLRAGVNP